MISVITSIFNQDASLLHRCAASVFSQSELVEWIIVDDGSKTSFLDSYSVVLREFCGPFRIIEIGSNQGLSVARNVGISQARGDWIVVLDSDDQLAPNTASMIGSLDDSIALVCFAVDFLRADETIEHRSVSRWERIFAEHAFSPADPFLWFDFYYHGLIVRREVMKLISGYDEKLEVGEDQDVLLRACEVATKDRIAFVDQIGYRYRENPFGVCATRWNEVEKNYASSMVAGARRRGANFDDCRLAEVRCIDGALVDEYEYRQGAEWIRWAELIGHDPF